MLIFSLIEAIIIWRPHLAILCILGDQATLSSLIATNQRYKRSALEKALYIAKLSLPQSFTGKLVPDQILSLPPLLVAIAE
jgi:hypothetical protein